MTVSPLPRMTLMTIFIAFMMAVWTVTALIAFMRKGR